MGQARVSGSLPLENRLASANTPPSVDGMQVSWPSFEPGKAAFHACLRRLLLLLGLRGGPGSLDGWPTGVWRARERAQCRGLRADAVRTNLASVSLVVPYSIPPFCHCCCRRLCLSVPVSPCDCLSSSAFCSCWPPDHNEEAQGERGGAPL